MKKTSHILIRMIYHIAVLCALFICADSVFLTASGMVNTTAVVICSLITIFSWVLPDVFGKDVIEKRVRQLRFGNLGLRFFLEALVPALIYTFFELFNPSGSMAGASWKVILFHIVTATVILSLTFWIGIIRIYLTSVQLGIGMRVTGIICGMLFPLNLIVLGTMIKITGEEVRFENEKTILDMERKDKAICRTKYPVLMLHGVFFRDYKYLDYWGRIPGELIKNGCSIYYGKQQSAGTVASCGEEVAQRIRDICEETGCDKVNIIAHSKGGLDARCAMADPEIAARVASLTTINTPHRGCEFADYLLGKIPDKPQKAVAAAYNKALLALGDYAPDFIGACRDLTHEACAAFNEKVKDPEGVYIQSYGSLLKNNKGGKFPLNLTYGFVELFDGGNDGLVGEASFKWGEDYHLMTAPGKRGISHADVIDLNRENIPGYDVREFYVKLVSDLREKGF